MSISAKQHLIGGEMLLKGPKGDKGDPGLPGETPVKGTDYFTEDDKAEMVSDILTRIDTSGKDSVKSVNGILPDDEGNVTLATENDAFDLLFEMGVVDPITDVDGTILTDADGAIFSL